MSLPFSLQRAKGVTWLSTFSKFIRDVWALRVPHQATTCHNFNHPIQVPSATSTPGIIVGLKTSASIGYKVLNFLLRIWDRNLTARTVTFPQLWRGWRLKKISSEVYYQTSLICSRCSMRKCRRSNSLSRRFYLLGTSWKRNWDMKVSPSRARRFNF